MFNSYNITAENLESDHAHSKKSKKREVVKVKIPQKLIENRRQEIISSLKKISDSEQVVIESIPRVYTGSKRGSNFRGVSVNGKKWQVCVFNNPVTPLQHTLKHSLMLYNVGNGNGLRKEKILRRNQGRN